jgi:hypothetical protein
MTTSPRWKHSDYGPYLLAGADGETIARIEIDGLSCLIRVRNRAGGWLYGSASTLPQAKRKAKRMIKEEWR